MATNIFLKGYLSYIAVFCAFLLSGCLYSTGHFNTGKLLEAGQSNTLVGIGKVHNVSFVCPEGNDWHSYSDTTGYNCLRSRFDGLPSIDSGSLPKQRKWETLPKIGFEYRLGIFNAFGPFLGADFGMHYEAPTAPISAEFDIRIGFPSPKNLDINHTLSAGWGIGLWADNSYFLEYALSKEWKKFLFFSNYRLTYLATQAADLQRTSDSLRFFRNQKSINQISFGAKWDWPEIFLLPDFIIPQIIVTYPIALVDDSYGYAYPKTYLKTSSWDYNLGIGWHFK